MCPTACLVMSRDSGYAESPGRPPGNFRRVRSHGRRCPEFSSLVHPQTLRRERPAAPAGKTILSDDRLDARERDLVLDEIAAMVTEGVLCASATSSSAAASTAPGPAPGRPLRPRRAAPLAGRQAGRPRLRRAGALPLHPARGVAPGPHEGADPPRPRSLKLVVRRRKDRRRTTSFSFGDEGITSPALFPLRRLLRAAAGTGLLPSRGRCAQNMGSRGIIPLVGVQGATPPARRRRRLTPVPTPRGGGTRHRGRGRSVSRPRCSPG
jgi:hypothetical protein